MKKVTTLLCAVLMSLALMAQVPQSFMYQTVARNNAGEILASQNITFRMSIVQGELPGTVIYTETHNVTTNAFGVTTLEIGRGTPVTGSFAAINWSTTPVFLKTEIDPAGGSAYFEMGTSELLSVPFAFESKHARALTLEDANGNEYEITVDTTGNLIASLILPLWECGSPFTDTRDGQQYETVQIGTQCWMAENLNIGTRIDGNSNQDNNTTLEKYCYYNSEDNCDVYGGLYQWNEMMNYTTTPGVQGICPEGWHLPTDAEWCTLTTYLDANVNCSTVGWSGTDAGCKMKETGTTHWSYPNTGATNSSGFTALPGGDRLTDGSFAYISEYGDWWSSSQDNVTNAWERYLSYFNTEVFRLNAVKSDGYSVRCLNNVSSNLANFNLNLEITPVAAGTVTGAGQYGSGEDVAISAVANNGWKFVYWTDVEGVISTDANFTFPMPAYNISLTANFIEDIVVFTCGNVLTDDRDNQQYETVQIGTQCWMAENLNIGTSIEENSDQVNNDIIEKYCFNNLDAYCDVYGGLYQWNEAMNYTATPGVQGICPKGWHIPTDAEWCTLTTYIDISVNCSTIGLTGTDAGGKMKEAGNVHWEPPNTGATNSSGFTALPGGWRGLDGFIYQGPWVGYWWSSSLRASSNPWGRNLIFNSAQVIRFDYEQSYGFSIRCLKN